MAAFIEAQRQGADGIELDVHPTRDGQLVVIHDATVQRTTQGYGAVVNLTLEQLQSLDAGHKFAPQFTGERIPTLRQVLEFSAANGLMVNVELKTGPPSYAGLERLVMRELRATAMLQHVVVSSFQPEVLVQVRALDDEVATALLTGEIHGASPHHAKAIGATAIHPAFRTVSPGLLNEALQLGLAVRPYTVNDEHVMQRLAAWGADGIITDDPRRAKALQSEPGP